MGSPGPVDPLDFLLENESGLNWGPKKISNAALRIQWPIENWQHVKLHFNNMFFPFLRHPGPHSNRTCVIFLGRNTCSKPQVHDTHFLVPSNVHFRIFRSNFSKLPSWKILRHPFTKCNILMTKNDENNVNQCDIM